MEVSKQLNWLFVKSNAVGEDQGEGVQDSGKTGTGVGSTGGRDMGIEEGTGK